jgi:hypothetical protein
VVYDRDHEYPQNPRVCTNTSALTNGGGNDRRKKPHVMLVHNCQQVPTPKDCYSHLRILTLDSMETIKAGPTDFDQPCRNIQCTHYDAIPKIYNALKAEKARISSGTPYEFPLVEVQPSHLENNTIGSSLKSSTTVSLSSEASLRVHAKTTSKKSKEKKGSNRRRRERRVEQAKSAGINKVFIPKLRSSIAQRLNMPSVVPVPYDAVNMPIANGAFGGKKLAGIANTVEEVESYLRQGFRVHLWDGK